MNPAVEDISKLYDDLGRVRHQIRRLEYDRDGLTFFRADKDDDQDYDPLTDASWEAASPTSGTINWNTVFAVPKRARAILIYVSGTIHFKAKSGTTNPWATTGEQRSVPVADDGTTYYFNGSGTVTVRVLGWWA